MTPFPLECWFILTKKHILIGAFERNVLLLAGSEVGAMSPKPIINQFKNTVTHLEHY